MNRPIHFEIPTDDPDRSRAFYRDVFGWKFQSWDGPQEYWLIRTGEETPGIDGGLLRRPRPGAGVVNTIGVTDLDTTLARVADAGGRIVAPRMEIPGVGHVAYFADLDGHTFGLLEPARS